MGKEKNIIKKSCTFDNTPPFRQFVAKQKNFTQSIRWLILDYIKQCGGNIEDIDDVCSHFENRFISGDCPAAVNEKM